MDIRQILFVLIASAAAVIALPYLNDVLGYYVHLHHLGENWLSGVFSNGQSGRILAELLALFFIPLIISLVISGIYWSVKRKKLPMFSEILWVLWIVLATVLIWSGH